MFSGSISKRKPQNSALRIALILSGHFGTIYLISGLSPWYPTGPQLIHGVISIVMIGINENNHHFGKGDRMQLNSHKSHIK